MIKLIFILFLLLISANISFSQPDISILQTNNVEYTLPILDINNNARLGGFGEVGVVSSLFYKNTGLYQNPALISRNAKYAGINFSYEPWLKEITDDLNISSVSGFYAIDSSNALGLNFSYFDMGHIDLISEVDEFAETINPHELFLKFGYTHSFKKSISTGIAIKYLRSKIGENLPDVKTINSFAVDIGFNYDKKYKLNQSSCLNTSLGVAITDFGPRVSYTSSDKNFIPTRFMAGLFINPDINLSHKFRFNIELGYQVEKYLVPTLPIYDTEGNIIDGYNPDISSFKALYQSFYDSPGGFEEEVNEIKHKFGSELRLSYSDIAYFAFRHGRKIEHETKGNRKYQTFGYGVGVYGFMLDYMKLKTENDSPLDGTWILTAGYMINLDTGSFKF